MTSPERWEVTQLIKSGVLSVKDYPDFDDETGQVQCLSDMHQRAPKETPPLFTYLSRGIIAGFLWHSIAFHHYSASCQCAEVHTHLLAI